MYLGQRLQRASTFTSHVYLSRACSGPGDRWRCADVAMVGVKTDAALPALGSHVPL